MRYTLATAAAVAMVMVAVASGLLLTTRSEAATGTISGQAFILNGDVLGVAQVNIGRVQLPPTGAAVDGGVASLAVGPSIGVGTDVTLDADLTSGTGTTHCEGDPGGLGEDVYAECSAELEDLDFTMTLQVLGQSDSATILSADLLRAVSRSDGPDGGNLSSTSAGSIFTGLCVLQADTCANVAAAGTVAVSGSLDLALVGATAVIDIGGTVEVFQDDETGPTATSVARSVIMLEVSLTLSATVTVGTGAPITFDIDTPVSFQLVRADSAIDTFAQDGEPTPTPTTTATTTVTATPTSTSTATATATSTATATPTTTSTATPTATATSTPTTTVTATPTSTATAVTTPSGAGGTGGTGGTGGAGAPRPQVTPRPPATGNLGPVADDTSTAAIAFAGVGLTLAAAALYARKRAR
ncbi:MAG: hypothetical protein R3B59_05425 [Dehalococcoidia bacterium]